jgi:hypothetical protein
MCSLRVLFALGLASLAMAADSTVYLIRHGEKPDDGDGLSSQGQERAQCLRGVFGEASKYDIGHIMAQTPQSGILLIVPSIGMTLPSGV